MSVTKQEREELSKLFEAVKDAASPMLGADPYHGGNYKQAWKEYDAACLALDAALTCEEPQSDTVKGFLSDQEREAIEVARDIFETDYSTAEDGQSDDLMRQHTLDILLRRDRGLCPVGHVAHDDGGTCPFCVPIEQVRAELAADGFDTQPLKDFVHGELAKLRRRPDPAASRGTPVSPLCEPLNGGGSPRNCQTGHAMRCARTDGVVCPEDSCDIDDGIYPKPQPVACQHRELLRECAGAIRVHGGEAFLLDRIATALAQPCAAQSDESARWTLIVNTIGQTSYEVSIERGFEYELRWDGVYRRRAGGGGV